ISKPLVSWRLYAETNEFQKPGINCRLGNAFVVSLPVVGSFAIRRRRVDVSVGSRDLRGANETRDLCRNRRRENSGSFFPAILIRLWSMPHDEVSRRLDVIAPGLLVVALKLIREHQRQGNLIHLQPVAGWASVNPRISRKAAVGFLLHAEE